MGAELAGLAMVCWFRRFRDLVHDQDPADQWYLFVRRPQLGRARALLAAEGIRVG